MSNKKVVIVGGNFAGMTGALDLKHHLKGDVDVTVISASDRFLFTPSLIWLPFGWRKEEDITFETGPVLEQHGVHFVHAPVTKIEPSANRVFANGEWFDYDFLLLATGPELNMDVVPGLGPEHGFSQNITTLQHAKQMGEAWKQLQNDPGPVVIGATQGAACFGAAYEFLFNFAHALRKNRMVKQVPLTYVTSEPFCGHFGIGGMKGGTQMLEFFFKRLGIQSISNVALNEIRPGEVELEDGKVLPAKIAMFIPPFTGVSVVRDTPDLGDAKGFIPTDPTYRHKIFKNIYAAGVAVTVQVPWVTPVATGIPKTGFPAEIMAKIAAHNIAAEIKGEEPKEEKAFGDMPAVCVMDAGNMGVMILGDKMLPPRKFEAMIPGPQAHWAKLAFEKYFLWKMKTGHVELP